MKVAILLFIFLFSSCFVNQKPKLIIPDAKRDEIFTRFANPITDKYELPKLRQTILSKDDLEIRVWFSASEIDGFILKRSDNEWNAIAIKEIDCRNYGYPKDRSYQTGKFNLSSPKSGWESVWQNLIDAEILELSYSDYISMIDEGSYKLETNTGGIYKIRFYGSKEKSREADQMRKIGEIIAEEFGLNNFKDGSFCSEK